MGQPSIDINDVDVRTLVFSATGVSGGAVYSVAIIPQGAPAPDSAFKTVSKTAGSPTPVTVDIPFGTTFVQSTLGGVGRYGVVGKVVDGSNVSTLASDYSIDFTDRTLGT